MITTLQPGTRHLEHIELKKIYGIKKSDLFLDYYFYTKKNLPKWLEKPFWRNKSRISKFGKIYEAKGIKVDEKERKGLINEFLRGLR